MFAGGGESLRRGWARRGVVIALASGCLLAPANAAANLGDGAGTDEPLLGVPGLGGLIADRAELTLDPDYWTQFIRDALSARLIAPLPVDAVKPEQALPTSPVAAGGGYVYPLRRRPLPLADVEYDWQGTTKTLAQFMRTSETDATLFVHDGRIVSELYENGWSARSRHQPWSVTKSFISSLVGIALADGKVRSLKNPIDSYIPKLRGTAWEGTTIRNLLEMESGVHWDEGTPVLVVNTQVQQWVEIILDYYTDGEAGQTRNEFLASLPRVAPQGTQFSYNSGNTQVLGWMLERVYDRPLNELLSAKLWKPAGMATSGRMMTDRVGNVIGSQGLYAQHPGIRPLRRAVPKPRPHAQRPPCRARVLGACVYANDPALGRRLCIPVVARSDLAKLRGVRVPGAEDLGRTGVLADRRAHEPHARPRPLERV